MNTLFTALVLFSLSAPSFAADKNMGDKNDAEMMKAYKEYTTPGEQHKTLAKMVGKWKYTAKSWMSDGGKEETSTGTSNMKMIYGGRFLQQDVKGMAMGMPFEGMMLQGYDNASQKFTSVWVDNMGTGIMNGTGTFDATTQTLAATGKMSCPMKKNQMVDYRTEWKMVDKDTNVYSMYTPDMTSGKEYKNMEITYKRMK